MLLLAFVAQLNTFTPLGWAEMSTGPLRPCDHALASYTSDRSSLSKGPTGLLVAKVTFSFELGQDSWFLLTSCDTAIITVHR